MDCAVGWRFPNRVVNFFDRFSLNTAESTLAHCGSVLETILNVSITAPRMASVTACSSTSASLLYQTQFKRNGDSAQNQCTTGYKPVPIVPHAL